MKLPKIFCKEKGLEEKTQQLVKEAKIHNEPKKSYLENLNMKATWLAINKGEGKIDYEDTPFQCRSVFDDKEKELTIDYKAIIDTKSNDIVSFDLVISYKDKIVFDENQKCIKNYSIGKWEDHVSRLFSEYGSGKD